MIIKNIKIIFTTLFICFSLFSYGEEQNSFEDYYVQINAKNLKDDFFLVKYDISNDEIYIGINSLFYFLEIYTLETDIKNKKISGEINNYKINIKFNNNEVEIIDNELFINLETLKEKLNFNRATYNSESLTVDIEPNFELPYELREKGKIERLRLEYNKEVERKKVDIEIPKKLVTPGLFKVEYSKYDIRENNYNLNFEYASQLLYGEFYLAGRLKPEQKIDYGNLTYSNIVKNNDLILGHFNLVAPSFLNVDTKVLGVSFDNNDTYLTKDSGITIIRGRARDADVIELYRNSFLLDYVNNGDNYIDRKFIGENFEFKVDDGILNSNYILKIYYRDGNIEERKVYSISDNDLLAKGKSRISIQGGKSDSDSNNQGIGKYYYGLSDNLTLGVGGMNLTSNLGKKYNILENDILLKTGTNKFPTLIQYKNYYEHKEKENSYEITVEQKIFEYNLRYEKNSYSKYIYTDTKQKSYDSLSLGRSFGRNSLELGVSKTIDINEQDLKEEKYRSIYALLDSYEFAPVYLSLKTEKTIEREEDKISYNPYVSYFGSNGMSIIADAKFEKRDSQDRYDEDYSLRLNLRRQKFLDGKVMADFGFEVNYSNTTHKPTYGITFNIELDDLIYGKLSSNTNIDESGNHHTSNGVYISKIIDVSNPTRQIKKNISLSNAWISGKVFLDINNNGVFDKGEKALPNVGVTANNMIFYTDENGNYIAEGLYSEEIIELGVDRKTIDPMTKYLKGTLKIKARKSAGMKVDIPISIVSMVTGYIWNTEDFRDKEFIQYLTMTTILLEKDGEIVDEIDPEFDGMFFFEDVPSGKYKIRFKYLGQDSVGFSIPEMDIDIKLENTDEGEYFEGFDTKMIKVKDREDNIIMEDY